MSELVIRRAKREDFPLVTALWIEMMDYHNSMDERFQLAPASDAAYLEYLYSIADNYDYAIFVAQRGQELLGYTIGMILSNPPVFALDRYGFIAEMSVRSDLRRGGVGKELWTHIRRWFYRRGVRVIQLNVSPRNASGYSFWKKSGCDEFLHILWHDIPANP